MSNWPDDRNMYGCPPCPKCGSKYRFPGTVGEVQRGIKDMVCDDCGHREPWDAWLTELLESEE